MILNEDLFEAPIKEGWESIDGLKFTRTGVHGEKLDDDWIDYGDYIVNKNRLQDEMLRDFKEESGYTRADEDREEFWNEFDEFIAERGREYLDRTVNESLKEDKDNVYDLKSIIKNAKWKAMHDGYSQVIWQELNPDPDVYGSYTFGRLYPGRKYREDERIIGRVIFSYNGGVPSCEYVPVKNINESFKEDYDLAPEEPSEETPATPEANGVAKLLLKAINDESDTIQEYNDLIANTDNEDIIRIIQDITAEENNHIGMLQRALEIISPNASNIEDGVEEAEGMIEKEETTAEPDFIPMSESLQSGDIRDLKIFNDRIQDELTGMFDIIGKENMPARKKLVKASFLVSEAVDDCIGNGNIDESLKEDVTKEWKPDTSFKHIKDVLTKALERGKYTNNEREEVLAAIDKADKGGYTPAQRQFIRNKHQEMWKKNRKVSEDLTEDLHDKFKREIKNAYKAWANQVERREAKMKEFRELIPDDASQEKIDAFMEFMNDKYPPVKDFKFDFPHNIEKDDYPFYVTYYAEYPIYEPAEGGYYYAGNDAIWSEGFNSKEEALEFARQQIAEDGDDWEEAFDGFFILKGKYIGEDQTLRVEPRKAYLSGVKGWEPYQ